MSRGLGFREKKSHRAPRALGIVSTVNKRSDERSKGQGKRERNRERNKQAGDVPISRITVIK